jgi:predicted GTPase
MTGVGKSTFINSVVNYFLGLEIENDFRYIVNKDMFNNHNGSSSTKQVNIYGMPKQGKMKKAMRLIDIPGLADTGGLMEDKRHIANIH